MRLRTQLVCASVAILAVSLVGAGTALAVKKASTQVFIDRVDPVADPAKAKYSGRVKSNKNKCLKGRKITLIHDSDPPFTIGEAETDAKGKWEITGNFPGDPSDDKLIVKVSKKGKCKGNDRSYRFYELPGAPGPE
jgi:hypothetical protein